nr:nucleotide-binding, alpha-beta plait [Tanacetum cinerariifolium]
MAMISAFTTVDKTAHNSRTTSRDLWLSFEKACAPHSTSREYTLKIQILRIAMHYDETHLNRAQEYADALAAISEPVKDKDLVMLVVSSLHEEYNSLKTTLTALSPIAPSGPQAFYGVCPSNNNWNKINNNCGNRNNSRGKNNNGVRGNDRQFDLASTQNTVYGTCNRYGIGHISSQCPNFDPSTIRTRPSTNFANTRAQSYNASAIWHSNTRVNSHVTPDLEAMNNSEAYYGDDALHVGNVSHLSPTSQTSLESSNGQASPVSTTSITTPPPPTPQPPPPITWQRLANLRQNPKQRVPYNPSVNHATVLLTTINEPTSFTVANNSSE